MQSYGDCYVASPPSRFRLWPSQQYPAYYLLLGHREQVVGFKGSISHPALLWLIQSMQMARSLE